jgi:hypothetical protein
MRRLYQDTNGSRICEVLASCCTQLETFVASQQKQLQGPRDEWLNSLMLRLAHLYCVGAW